MEIFYIFLGETKVNLVVLYILKKMYGKVAGSHPEVDFEKELALWNTVIEANKQGLLKSLQKM